MKKAILFGTLILAGTLCLLASVQQQQMSLGEKMLRFHVVANSDTEHDQSVKLQVRDAVLSVTEDLADKTQIEEALPEILAAAETAACGQSVQITLEEEELPERTYGSFTLPAGIYPTLRITLGEGKGQNWWCVIFPSLCLRAASEVEAAAVSAGFTRQEIRLITEDRYVLRFKTLELIQRLREFFNR